MTIEEFVDAWTDSRWQIVREEQSERKEKMTKDECVSTLITMVGNCKDGTKYDDPMRWKKAEALQYAISVLQTSENRGDRKYDPLVEDIEREMKILGAHYASMTVQIPGKDGKYASITIHDKDWSGDES